LVNILLGKISDNADCDNSPKSLLLRDFNIAVAQGDLEFIGRHVTDDIVWHLLEPDGQKKIQGRDEVLAEYKHNMVTSLKSSPLTMSSPTVTPAQPTAASGQRTAGAMPSVMCTNSKAMPKTPKSGK
jgi:hypothetical protein